MILFVLYVLGAFVSLLWVGRRLAAVCLRKWPNLYPSGVFEPDASDVWFALFMAAVWPMGVPMIFLLTTDWRRTRTPGRVARLVFGRGVEQR